jgi:uncharacterized membrane protein YkvA (DUF1232 family)
MKFKDLLVGLAAFISLVYLLNPTAGIIELIPDNFPIVGNLDEAAAVAIILAAFRYYGIDLTSFLGRGVRDRSKSSDKKDDPKSPSS